eukprot:TRINITY_DN19209_c0_g1_i1.p1 TRINITY_DN19209_c0_g1~~TRINITY_DN19209_c0_g1_i1.p1  ORF type:complete len:1228 (-),score=257.14 TRINITY_DN19209_c0_g1_i1:22-3705(-)
MVVVLMTGTPSLSRNIAKPLWLCRVFRQPGRCSFGSTLRVSPPPPPPAPPPPPPEAVRQPPPPPVLPHLPSASRLRPEQKKTAFEEHGPEEKATSFSSRHKKAVFEEHWSEEKVEEGLKGGELVRGRLHVPSFHTDTAYVVAEVPVPPHRGSGSVNGPEVETVWIPVTGFVGRNRAFHGDEVAAMPMWTPWRPQEPEGSARSGTPAVKQETPSPLPQSGVLAGGHIADTATGLSENQSVKTVPAESADVTDGSLSPQEKLLADFRSAVLARLRDSEEQALPLTILGAIEEVQKLRKGLGNMRKALQKLDGDVELVEEGTPPELVAKLKVAPAEVPKPPQEDAPTLSLAATATQENAVAGSEHGNWAKARCRVVAVLERSPKHLGEIVALLQLPKRESNSAADSSLMNVPLKAQPRDRRLPAFWIAHPQSQPFQPASAQADQQQSNKKEKRAQRREEARAAALAAREQSLTREAVLQHLQGSGTGATSGALCIIRFEDWSAESLSPHARVVEVLGQAGTASAEADALLAFFGLEWRPFSQDVENELRDQFPDGASVVASELCAGRRQDLRGLPCVTIDPPTAKDLDDAVSVAPGKQPGTIRVGVHVADVTHFVHPGSATDLEARRRATTVYLVGRVYPMLPRWLSENLCSLLPDGDRLSFSVFFTLREDGSLDLSEPPEICRAVIRTQAKLDYNTVDSLLADRSVATEGGVPADLLEDLTTLARVTAARRNLRIKEGAVTLERSSVSFEFDDEGRVAGLVRESSSSVSHHLIEELMVLANHVVAARLQESSIESSKSASPKLVRTEAAVSQALLRRHPDTEAQVREQVFKILPEQLHKQAPADASLQELLLWCKNQLPPATYEAVCADVLTAFKEAEYIVADDGDQENPPGELGHWALSLPSYMHFTSPIRRYADVLVHRRLAYIINAETSAGKEKQDIVNSYDEFLDSLKEAVHTCNMKKRDAQDAQLDAVQLALAEYVQRSGGVDVEDAVITRLLLPLTPNLDAGDEGQNGQQLSFHKRLTKRTHKEAIEFYVPLGQCSRSVSLESLNLELVQPPNKTTFAESAPVSIAEKNDLDKKGKRKQKNHQEVPGIRVRVRGTSQEHDLHVLQRMTVRLTSGSPSTAQDDETGSERQAAGGHWTIRLPWAEVSAPTVPPPPPIPPAAAPAAARIPPAVAPPAVHLAPAAALAVAPPLPPPIPPAVTPAVAPMPPAVAPPLQPPPPPPPAPP